MIKTDIKLKYLLRMSLKLSLKQQIAGFVSLRFFTATYILLAKDE